MKILLDMNISPSWAREHDSIVFTHDLDFGALLFATQVKKPRVVQIRTEDIRPQSIGELVIGVLESTQQQLNEGALVTIHPRKSRVRLLPFRKQ